MERINRDKPPVRKDEPPERKPDLTETAEEVLTLLKTIRTSAAPRRVFDEAIDSLTPIFRAAIEAERERREAEERLWASLRGIPGE